MRLYSLPLMLFFRRTGFNILAIEPTNLILYLMILFLVYQITETLFDSQAALFAAAIVAIWPTLLFHTTQLLRDPLLIVLVLAFTYCFVRCLSHELSWSQLPPIALLGIVSIVAIRIVRMPMWPIVAIAVIAGSVLLLLQAARESRARWSRAIMAAVLLLAIFIVPRFQPFFRNQQAISLEGPQASEEMAKLTMVRQLELRRQGFINYGSQEGRLAGVTSGSNIDTDVHFTSRRDILWDLPRAIAIGFFAPFPDMWATAGQQIGYRIRALVAIETVMTYLMEVLALWGLWHARQKAATWFIAIFSLGGITSLGLVVANVGALYRLRYPFWILIVIIGAGGFMHAVRYRSARTER